MNKQGRSVEGRSLVNKVSRFPQHCNDALLGMFVAITLQPVVLCVFLYCMLRSTQLEIGRDNGDDSG